MKAHISGFVVSGLCAAVLIPRVQAQPADHTRPIAVVPPIVVAPVAGVAPLGVPAKENEVAAVGVSASAAKMPILVEKLRARSITPQQAWDAGDLDVPDLIYFLESLDSWGGFHWDKDHSLRRQMVALLVQHGQKQLEQPEKLSSAVRLWLADYYGNIGDDRVLALAESILSEVKTPTSGSDALMFQAVERIAWFHRTKNEHEMAAKTWARMPTAVTNTEWMIPDAVWQAGKMYLWLGDEEKAQSYFSKVQAGKNNFFRGMVSHDKATFLLDNNKPDATRDLLLHELPALLNQGDRIAPLWALVQSYWRLEQWSESEAILKELFLIEQQKNAIPENSGFEEIFKVARRRLKVLQAWKGKSFELVLRTPLSTLNEKGFHRVQFSAYSWSKEPLKILIDNPNIKLINFSQKRALRAESGVVVSVYDLSFQAPGSGSFQAQVSLTSNPNEAKPLEIVWKSASE